MFEEMNQRLESFGVVPVTVLHHAEDAIPLSDALCAGGLPCAEITFRTDAAEAAIRMIHQTHPEMLVGAGTVLSVEQARCAVTAGAQFIVCPGFDAEIVDDCIANGIPVYPGTITPSEVMQGYKRGLRALKFFPAAEGGGTAGIKAIAAAFPGVRFMPTGGVNAENLREYLESKFVFACGGSWMVKANLIEAGAFDGITQLCTEAVSIVKEVRS